MRFDQDSVIEVVLSADTMSQWTSESLKLTILKKDFNCPEVDDNNNRSVHEVQYFKKVLSFRLSWTQGGSM